MLFRTLLTVLVSLFFVVNAQAKEWEGPDFLIIGAQKGGTTSMYHYLTQHPQVQHAKKKEINFFTDHFEEGVDWYRNQFFRRVPGKLQGEASPIYLFHHRAPERVYSLFPKVKLIVLLRDPVARAFSHYKHNVRKGREKRTFDEAINKEMKTIDADLAAPELRKYGGCYVKRGVYVDQIKRWTAYFPTEQILFLKSEDFFKDPKGTMEVVHKFLGIGPLVLKTYAIANKGDPDIILSQEAKDRLTEYYKPHNAALQDLLTNTLMVNLLLNWK